jgi:hypothetical protein
MPFTLSHPLAVIPFARTRLVFSALVIGSMSPDFEYFLRLDQSGHASHSTLGIVVFCLPASLVVMGLWHGLMKHFLLQILPDVSQRKLAACCEMVRVSSIRDVAWVVASVLVGATTHVVWDSFTHPWGWPVQTFEFLQYQVTDNGFLPMTVFKFLQYGSSVGALVVLLGLAIRWYWQAPSREVSAVFTSGERWCFVGGILGLAAVVGVGLAWRRFPPTLDMDHFKAFVVRSLVGFMAFFLWETVLLSLWYRWKFGRRGF